MSITFEAQVSASACKTLSKICSVYSKLFEYVTIELKHDSMVFCGVNSLKSAFISLQLEQAFFDLFQWSDVDQTQTTYAFCIKVPSKSLVSLFRSAAPPKGFTNGGSSGKSQENDTFSSISLCKISFDPQSCKFVISVTYSYGLARNTTVFYEETEAAYPIHKDASDFEYTIGAPARTMLDWISCFSGQSKCDEILFEFDCERAIVGIRSGEMVEAGQRTSTASTKLTIKRHQFDEYCIGHVRAPDRISLCIAFIDFKLMLLLAASLEADLSVRFDSNLEEPLLFVADGCLKNTCQMTAIFAKNNPDDSFHSLDAHLNSESFMSAFPTDEPLCQPVLANEAYSSGSEEFVPSTPPSKRFADD